MVSIDGDWLRTRQLQAGVRLVHDEDSLHALLLVDTMRLDPDLCRIVNVPGIKVLERGGLRLEFLHRDRHSRDRA